MKSLKDIAKAADVSMITVSRVINGSEKVKPETKKYIEEIMSSMAYIPNMAAKNLVARRSGVIDIYIPENIDLSDPFMMQFIVGISETLSAHMYSFLLKRSWAKEHSCDGYIVTGLLTNEIDDFYARAKARNLPVVLFGHTDIEEVDYFDVDNVAGGMMAVNYLLQHGHTRIAMINSSEDKDYAADRRMGYEKALRSAGIVIDPRLMAQAENTVEDGKRAVNKLLDSGEFTAVFCATDPLAIGAINGINEAALRVPDDISVIGFDGLGRQFLANIPVTTIRQPVLRIGKILAETLINRINGEKTRTTGFLQPELLPGRSVQKREKISSTTGDYHAE
jgi:LacI family transcriptional regulator